MTKRTIKAKNIGPIAEAVGVLPDPGGVMVWKAKNGHGKSTILNAMEKLVGREADTITPRDGHERGEIEGLGITVTVGRSTRRTGELVVLAMESKLGIADLVDPGIADPSAADEKRMKAILAILRVQPTLEDWMPIAGDDEALQAFIEAEYARTKDVLIFASRVKAAIEKQAQAAEKSLQAEEAKLSVYYADPRIKAAEEPEAPATTDQLARGLEAAKDALNSLKSRKERSEAVAAIREEIESLAGDVCNVEELDGDIADLNDSISKLSKCLAQAEKDRAALVTKRDSALKAKTRIAELDGKIGNAVAPSESEMIAAHEAVEQARQAFVDAETVRGVIATRSKAKELAAIVAVSRATAERCRKAAEKPGKVLERLMGAKVPGLRYEDGRMIYKHPEQGDVPFARLSKGERVTVATSAAVRGIGKGGLAMIPQEFWEGLDTDHRGIVRDIAREGEVVIATAQWSDDEELTATVYGE